MTAGLAWAEPGGLRARCNGAQSLGFVPIDRALWTRYLPLEAGQRYRSLGRHSFHAFFTKWSDHFKERMS